MATPKQSGEPPRPCANQPDATAWLDTDETANALGLKPKTLANMRSLGTGPVFHKLGGKVWYLGGDIIRYRCDRRYRASGERDEG